MLLCICIIAHIVKAGCYMLIGYRYYRSFDRYARSVAAFCGIYSCYYLCRPLHVYARSVLARYY